MVYPKEGSTLHNHAAAIVLGNWVTPEQTEAARRWIDFLHEDAQQETFMEWGFRPATALPLRCPVCPSYGIDPVGPTAVMNMSAFQPGVRDAMVAAWGDVPGPTASISE